MIEERFAEISATKGSHNRTGPKFRGLLQSLVGEQNISTVSGARTGPFYSIYFNNEACEYSCVVRGTNAGLPFGQGWGRAPFPRLCV